MAADDYGRRRPRFGFQPLDSSPCFSDCNLLDYTMIKGFKHKGLRELFEDGTTGKVRKDLQDRCLRRLDALHHARSLDELRVPGFNFHALKGVKRYTIHVNGPWCITFEFEDGDVYRVDPEQYH